MLCCQHATAPVDHITRKVKVFQVIALRVTSGNIVEGVRSLQKLKNNTSFDPRRDHFVSPGDAFSTYIYNIYRYYNSISCFIAAYVENSITRTASYFVPRFGMSQSPSTALP